MKWEKPVINKELHFVYIVKGKKFLKKSDAELYIVDLEVEATYKKGFIDA